jgi:cell wall-associated NlpC family hydrolase
MKIKTLIFAFILVGYLGAIGFGDQNDIGKVLVKQARKYLGIEFKQDGRLTKKNPGLDCMGLCFITLSKVTGADWRKISIYPTKIISKNELGKVVPGTFGIKVSDLDWQLLKPGDFIFLLGPFENPKEKAIYTDDAGEKFWVWHMGIYSGGKDHSWINADTLESNKVIEVSLHEYMTKHALFFERLIATRWK